MHVNTYIGSHTSMTVREVSWDTQGRIKYDVRRKSDNRYMSQIWAHNPNHAVIGFVKDLELRPDAVDLYYAIESEAQNLGPNNVVAL